MRDTITIGPSVGPSSVKYIPRKIRKMQEVLEKATKHTADEFYVPPIDEIENSACEALLQGYRDTIRSCSKTARLLYQYEQEFYKEEVKRQFKDERALRSLDVQIKGSNLWKVLFLRQIGIPVATLEEITTLAEFNPEFLKGFYHDSPSVVLRSARHKGQNDYLAKQLAQLIGQKNISAPYLISGLRIKEDSNSEYGLSFEKGKDFRYFQAPELIHKNNRRRFSKFTQDGMPLFDENGDKTNYTRENGLSRLNLGRDLDLNSNWGDVDLADSDGDGRVVVIDCAEGAASQKVDTMGGSWRESDVLKPWKIKPFNGKPNEKSENHLSLGQLFSLMEALM